MTYKLARHYYVENKYSKDDGKVSSISDKWDK